MGWKSTLDISRKDLEETIMHELQYNIENLSDFTLCYVLEILSEDKNCELRKGFNYTVE